MKFAMKASGEHIKQIRDRYNKMKSLKLNPIIELWLPGLDSLISEKQDIIKQNCGKFEETEYILHFPIMDIENNYIFDAYYDEKSNLKKIIELCKKIKSDKIIMHRCCGFDKNISKNTAETIFLERVIEWNELGKQNNIMILIENYGFVWLPKGFKKKYVVSPLDHFFPWDILEFYENKKKYKLNNIEILLDIAHCVLSANMFNMKKNYPNLEKDNRFSNIYKDDLDKINFLRIEDFIFDFIDYFHISDTFIWHKYNGINNMQKFLYKENLPIGIGNINYKKVLKKISNKLLIMEIDPDNNNYENNLAQLEAIKKFMNN